MSIITYVPAPGYPAGEQGVINVGGGISFNVGAALISGSGVITVDSSVSPNLVDALDHFPGLIRQGTTPGPVSNTDAIAPVLAHSLRPDKSSPQVGDVLGRGADGLYIPQPYVSGVIGLGISKFKAFGHSHVYGTGTRLAYGFTDMLGDSLRAPERGRNYGHGGAVLPWDDQVISGHGEGGWTRLGKFITKQQPGGPFPAYQQLCLLMYGHNDIGAYAADGAGLLKFQHALRFAIVRCISSDIRDILNGSWGSNVGFLGGGADATHSDAQWYSNADGNHAAYTVPSGYTGNDLWLCAGGYNGGGATLTCTVGGATVATLDTKAVSAAGFNYGRWVPAMVKIPGRAAGDVIIVTTSNSSGGTQYSGIFNMSILTDAPGPLVLLVLPIQVPAAAGAGYTYPYDGANTITNAKIQALRTAMISLAAEFPNNVVVVDADPALGPLNAANFYSDGVHPNEYGHARIAAACADALHASPLFTENWLMKTAVAARDPITTLYYSTSITPDMREGEVHELTVTNATAFTMNIPGNVADVGNEIQAEDLTLTIWNNTAGAMGTITWASGYIFPGGTPATPAAGKSKMLRFKFDGFHYVNTYVSADY